MPMHTSISATTEQFKKANPQNLHCKIINSINLNQAFYMQTGQNFCFDDGSCYFSVSYPSHAVLSWI